MFDSGTRSRGLVRCSAVPLVAVLAADAVQVGAGALAAPLERVVVDELAGHRVVAVAQRLGAQRRGSSASGSCSNPRARRRRGRRAAARCSGFRPGDRLRRRALEEQRHDLDQAADRDDEQDQHDHQEVVGLDALVTARLGVWCSWRFLGFRRLRRSARQRAGSAPAAPAAAGTRGHHDVPRHQQHARRGTAGRRRSGSGRTG